MYSPKTETKACIVRCSTCINTNSVYLYSFVNYWCYLQNLLKQKSLQMKAQASLVYNILYPLFINIVAKMSAVISLPIAVDVVHGSQMILGYLFFRSY